MRSWNWKSNLRFRTSSTRVHSHSSHGSQAGNVVVGISVNPAGFPWHLHSIIGYHVSPKD